MQDPNPAAPKTAARFAHDSIGAYGKSLWNKSRPKIIVAVKTM